MESGAPKQRAFPQGRVWILFGLFLALWIGLAALNRPEPSYADQPLSYWLDRMANENTAAHASTVLREMGPEAVPALQAALRTRESILIDSIHAGAVRLKLAGPRSYDAPNVRATAAYLLGQLGETAGPAVPDLVNALDDADPMVRYRAIRTLSKVGMIAGPDLAQALQSPEPIVRYGAAKALGGMGAKARYTAGALMNCLSDPQANVREAAFHALAQIGERAQRGFTAQSVPRLVEALTNSPWAISRKFALQTLRKIGPGAKPAVAALTAAKKDLPELAPEIQETLAAIEK